MTNASVPVLTALAFLAVCASASGSSSSGNGWLTESRDFILNAGVVALTQPGLRGGQPLSNSSLFVTQCKWPGGKMIAGAIAWYKTGYGPSNIQLDCTQAVELTMDYAEGRGGQSDDSTSGALSFFYQSSMGVPYTVVFPNADATWANPTPTNYRMNPIGLQDGPRTYSCAIAGSSVTLDQIQYQSLEYVDSAGSSLSARAAFCPSALNPGLPRFADVATSGTFPSNAVAITTWWYGGDFGATWDVNPVAVFNTSSNSLIITTSGSDTFVFRCDDPTVDWNEYEGSNVWRIKLTPEVQTALCSGNLKTIIGVAVGASVGAAAIVAIIVTGCYVRRRRRAAAAKAMSSALRDAEVGLARGEDGPNP